MMPLLLAPINRLLSFFQHTDVTNAGASSFAYAPGRRLPRSAFFARLRGKCTSARERTDCGWNLNDTIGLESCFEYVKIELFSLPHEMYSPPLVERPTKFFSFKCLYKGGADENESISCWRRMGQRALSLPFSYPEKVRVQRSAETGESETSQSFRVLSVELQ